MLIGVVLAQFQVMFRKPCWSKVCVGAGVGACGRVCVHPCMHVHLWVCACTCGGQVSMLGIFLNCSLSYFGDKVSRKTRSSLIWFGQLAGKIRLMSPVLDADACHHAQHFMWVLGRRPQVLILEWQALYWVFSPAHKYLFGTKTFLVQTSIYFSYSVEPLQHLTNSHWSSLLLWVWLF